MAANDVNLKINLDDYGSVSTIGELKKQLKELKSAALEAGEGSEAFNKISQKAGELNDQIVRVNESISRNTGNAVENATKGLTNLAGVGVGAFQAVQGAMAMFGVESQDLQKTLVALNGAMALSQGLKSLSEAPDIISDATKAISTFALGTDGAALSLKGFKGALVATGIGAFVVALGFAIDYFTKLDSSTEKATESVLDFGKATESAAEKTSDELVKLQSLLAVARDETKSRQDRVKAVKELNELSPKYLGNLTLEGINTKQATDMTNLYTEALLKNAKAIAAKDILADIEKQILLAEPIDEIGKKLFDNQQRLSLGITETEQKFRQSQGTLASFVTTASGFVAQKAALMDTITKNTVDFGNKSSAATEKVIKTTDKLDISFKQFGETSGGVTAKGIENLDGLLFAYDKYNKDIISGSNEIAAVQIENDRRVSQEKEASIQKGFQIAQLGANALMSLNDLITQNELKGLKAGERASVEIQKKQFNRSKVLGIVSTSINTAEAIVSALKVDPSGILSGINAVIGAIQIATIASKQFNPDSGGGSNGNIDTAGIGGSGNSQQPSTFTAPQFFGLGNGTNPNNTPQQSLQVYVLENDITNSQQNVLGYIQTSVLTLGQPENTNGPFGPI